MNRTVQPGPRTGTAEIPASKSRAHRLLICAALSGEKRTLRCQGLSQDILATVSCLNGMGSRITCRENRIDIAAGRTEPKADTELRCGESGSTLRFLLPVVGALGLRGSFFLEGRLPQRPLQPLWDLLCDRGMQLELKERRLFFSGRLQPGDFAIPGNVSSQYISGLLFALPLLEGESRLTVTGETESADYIAMTEEALAQFGVPAEKERNVYRIGAGGYRHPPEGLPDVMEVEADWSSAAFFLALGALSPEGVTVSGMNLHSRQGDRRILPLLERFGAKAEVGENRITVRGGALRGQEIDASAIPDLVPVLATVAAAARGRTEIRHAERLRLKESDRLKTTTAMLGALGADIRETEDGLIIDGREGLRGGTVSSFRDHRIAMSAAVAASVCSGAVTVLDAECTDKSFPFFWERFQTLRLTGRRAGDAGDARDR